MKAITFYLEHMHSLLPCWGWALGRNLMPMVDTMQSLPVFNLEQGVLRAWWFEPLLATASFAFFVNLYWYHERLRGLSSTKSFFDTVELGFGPLFNSALAYWVGICMWKMVVPAVADIPDGVPHNLNELAYMLAETVSGIVLYDAIFFFVHLAMHEVPFLRCLHRYHHDNRQNTQKGTLESRDTLRHSLIDGTMQVYINILVQRKTPWGAAKTRCARFLHNIIVTWMLVESHTASPTPWVWRKWCIGVREHRLHHLGDGKQQSTSAFGHYHRYQQFFGYLDSLRDAWRQRECRKEVKEAIP
jgi:sterol desaturase/sphingolipid hydroxylase (fatty acid hydroxylase superfamily)